jgi:hypothetical protein
MISLPATAGALHFSGAAEADGHFAVLDDHRHLAPAIGMLQHFRQRIIVFEHVAVFEANLPSRESLPGRGGIRSKVFAKNYDGVGHICIAAGKRCSSKIGARRLNCK